MGTNESNYILLDKIKHGFVKRCKRHKTWKRYRKLKRKEEAALRLAIYKGYSKDDKIWYGLYREIVGELEQIKSELNIKDKND